MSGNEIRDVREAHGILRRRCACAALMIFGMAWGAGAAPGAEIEVGGPSAPRNDLTGASLDYEIEIGLSLTDLAEDDMGATYGDLPAGQVRLSVRTGRTTRFFLGTGYGRSGGDPFYDRPTYDWSRDAELTVVPIQMGLRINLLPRDDFRLNLGFLMDATWVRETLPSGDPDAPDAVSRGEGWSRGVGATFGPEWRSPDLGWAVGIEAGVAGGSGDVGRRHGHDVDLTGMSGRLYFTRRI